MYQKLIIAGHVGSIEQRYTPEGKAVTTFSLAASTRKDETVWFRVTAWDKLAETAYQYVRKGSKVLVEGRLRADSSGNPNVFQRKDGTYGASFEVTADNVRFVGSKERDDAADDYSADVPF